MSKDQNAYLLINGDSRKKIPCLFNPTELSLTLSNRWGAGSDAKEGGNVKAGAGVQILDFQGADNGSMDLTLFFDTTSQGVPVTKYTSQIVALMEIDTKIPGTNEKNRLARPPTVKFGWGELTSFEAVITTLTLKFTYFSSKGMPLRATMGLSLKQYAGLRDYGPQNPTSVTPAPHQVHRVQPGETLDRISAEHFADSTKWRIIAEANNVEDPLDLRAGSLLMIPKLTG